MSALQPDVLRLAAQLLDSRETAQRLFGDRYNEVVQPWREFVRAACAKWGCSALHVAARMQREGTLPEKTLLLIAASVDVAEEPERGGAS